MRTPAEWNCRVSKGNSGKTFLRGWLEIMILLVMGQTHLSPSSTFVHCPLLQKARRAPLQRCNVSKIQLCSFFTLGTNKGSHGWKWSKQTNKGLWNPVWKPSFGMRVAFKEWASRKIVLLFLSWEEWQKLWVQTWKGTRPWQLVPLTGLSLTLLPRKGQVTNRNVSRFHWWNVSQDKPCMMTANGWGKKISKMGLAVLPPNHFTGCQRLSVGN